jgi:methyl-accepting chemotaxis protein
MSESSASVSVMVPELREASIASTPDRPSGAINRGESGDLGVAWMVSAILGFACIWFSSGSSAASTVALKWRSVLPVAVMFGYLIVGYKRQTRNTMRLADSVYFLGFLWTLFALIATLVRHGDDVSAGDVFVVFGYALVTTAAGMFVRLALVQFQRTVDDQLTDARDDIDIRVGEFVEGLKRATGVISQTAEQLNAQRTSLDGAMKQLEAQRTSVDGAMKQLEAKVRALDLPPDSLLSEAKALLVSEVKGVFAPAAQEVTKVATSTRALGLSVVAVKDHVETVKTDLVNVHKSLKSLSEATLPAEQGLRGLHGALAEVVGFMRAHGLR